MHFFFRPQAIAVVGATPNRAKGGYAILKNLINTFPGIILPVNPQYTQIEGLTCYPAVRNLPGRVDLAILFIPADRTLSAVGQCIEKGIPGVIIESGGFSEIGASGHDIQKALASLAREGGIRIWGPNCMGIVDARQGFVFSFTDPGVLYRSLKPGRVSLVVQSGMLSAGFLVDILSHDTCGLNKVCSIGNRADVDESDLLEYLMRDGDTGAIGFYLESAQNLRRFTGIYEKHGRSKPVVFLKGGKSASGARAALSHTASIAGNYRILHDTLVQAGMTPADDFHQLVDLCRTLDTVPPPSKGPAKNIAVLTFSGASGIVASDFMDRLGLKPARLSDATRKTLARFFPSWMPVENPVDVWPAMEQHSGKGLDIYALALDACLRDPDVDAVMIHTFAGFSRVRLDLEETARISSRYRKPVFVWVLGEKEHMPAFWQAAGRLGIPVYHELYRAVECMAAALNRSAAVCTDTPLEKAPAPSPAFPVVLPASGGILDEYASKRILRKAGLPTVEEIPIANITDAVASAAHLGYPVVLKGLAEGRLHKSEAGLVITDIRDANHLEKSFDELLKKLHPGSGMLLQRQVSGWLELIMGYLRDPQYGPCVMFGLGGLFAETLGDAIFSPAPLTLNKAADLVNRLKNRHLLAGTRGKPAAPREDIARCLVSLGELGVSCPSIREMDLNPLILSETGPVIVDASILVDSAETVMA